MYAGRSLPSSQAGASFSSLLASVIRYGSRGRGKLRSSGQDRRRGGSGAKLGLVGGTSLRLWQGIKGGIEITVGMEYGETKKVNLYFISTIYGVHFFFFFLPLM
jgi:hypothetical protein